MSSAAADDARRAREEYRQLVASWNHEDFLGRCRTQCAGLIEDPAGAARHVADAALQALSVAAPFLMVRIGEGEANLLRYAAHPDAFEKKWADAILQLQDSQALGAEDTLRIAEDMRAAFAPADVIGVRPLGPLPVNLQLQGILDGIDSGDLRGALGTIGAFHHAREAVCSGLLSGAVVLSAWVHLGLLEHLDRLLGAARRVIVITGRVELEAPLRERLADRLHAFLPVPLQASDQTLAERPFHYPRRYREISGLLHQDLSGTLVLVGAGLFGKHYCAVARRGGAVALDVGSAFDVLAGQRTRPAHTSPNFIDTERRGWLSGAGNASLAAGPQDDPPQGESGFDAGILGALAAHAPPASLGAGLAHVDAFSNGELSIPVVAVGSAVYTDVRVAVRRTLSVRGGTPALSQDVYDPATNRLTIAAVQCGDTIFTNVVVVVDRILAAGAAG